MANFAGTCTSDNKGLLLLLLLLLTWSMKTCLCFEGHRCFSKNLFMFIRHMKK